MCELLGISFNMKVNISLSFNIFKYRSDFHPNGWGIAFYHNGFVRLIKEPVKMGSALLAHRIDWNNIKSNIFILHIRRASLGTCSYVNTHPFVRLLGDKEIVFAHNGTLRGYKKLKLKKYYPVGDTDSEYVFCYLIQEIEKNGLEWNYEGFKKLLDIIYKINEFGPFNFLMSDGEYLFAYKDIEGRRELHFLKRVFPYDKIRLRDLDYEVNLGTVKNPNERGFIIATNPLTDEDWKSFKDGELIVFKNGEMIYSNKRLSDLELKILKILRESPHRVSLGDITNKIRGLSHKIIIRDDVKIGIKSLLDKGYIKQDSRDTVNWDNVKATFYTRKNKRDEIDRELEGFRWM
ncbi:class II glutamine amidotransferase [Methanocaldococcus indicus]|uniref:class II glutamine amidotransferase n=1 Tax=Methanocaldococcus indicus TaxID=213231 RepID=UPI003C6D4A27